MCYRKLTTLLFALLSGCALSPQTVRIHPALDVSQLAPRAQVKSIALSVGDTRQNRIVGYRGGVYATASITADANLTGAVRAELSHALGKLGLQVVEDGANADISLGVEIAELGYAVTEDRVTRTIETVAMVRGKSTAGAVTRTGEYRDRRTKEVVKAPSDEDNEELLNDVLSASLQRLVSDPDLLQF